MIDTSYSLKNMNIMIDRQYEVERFVVSNLERLGIFPKEYEVVSGVTVDPRQSEIVSGELVFRICLEKQILSRIDELPNQYLGARIHYEPLVVSSKISQADSSCSSSIAA